MMVVLLSMTTLSSCSSHLDGGLAEQQEEEGNWTEFVRVKPLLDARVMVHMRFHTHAQRMPRTHFNLIPMALGLVSKMVVLFVFFFFVHVRFASIGSQ